MTINISQTVILLVVINMSLIGYNFAVSYSDDLPQLQERINSYQTDKFSTLNKFQSDSSQESNWKSQLSNAALNAASNVVNVLFMVGAVLLLIIYGLVSIPFTAAAYENNAMRMVGFFGWLVLMYINILGVLNIYAFVKGNKT